MIGDVTASGGYIDDAHFGNPVGLRSREGLFGGYMTHRERRKSKFGANESRARKRARVNKIELERLKNIYAGLDVRNPYLDMDRSMKNLQVQTKQAEFQKQQFQQGQANMLRGLRGSTGNSGLAVLAQSLSRQGMMSSQQVSSSIGQQESKNQMLVSQQSQRIQELERKGTQIPIQFQAKKLALLMGMTQQEMAMHRQQELQYRSIYEKVSTQAKAAQAAATAGIMGKLMGAAGSGAMG